MTSRTIRFSPFFDAYPYEYYWTYGYGCGYYKTNPNGEGIFYVDKDGKEQQLVGTCQFSVRGLTRGSGKNKIRKWMKGD